MEPESLVVDANIVFGALSKRGFTFEFIRSLSRTGFGLYSPEYISEEIDDKMEKLLLFSKLSRTELEFLIRQLFRRVEVVSKSRYKTFLPEAEKLLPEHPEDSPYLALAIALGCPLWSNEKRLKKQSRVKVLATHELKLLV